MTLVLHHHTGWVQVYHTFRLSPHLSPSHPSSSHPCLAHHIIMHTYPHLGHTNHPQPIPHSMTAFDLFFLFSYFSFLLLPHRLSRTDIFMCFFLASPITSIHHLLIFAHPLLYFHIFRASFHRSSVYVYTHRTTLLYNKQTHGSLSPSSLAYYWPYLTPTYSKYSICLLRICTPTLTFCSFWLCVACAAAGVSSLLVLLSCASCSARMHIMSV